MEKAGWGHISKRWIWYTPLCCNQPLSLIPQTVIVYSNFLKIEKQCLQPSDHPCPKPREGVSCEHLQPTGAVGDHQTSHYWPFFSLIRKTFKGYYYCCPGKLHLINGSCPVHDTSSINQDWILFQFIMVAVQMKKCLYRKNVLQYKCANDVITDFKQKKKILIWVKHWPILSPKFFIEVKHNKIMGPLRGDVGTKQKSDVKYFISLWGSFIIFSLFKKRVDISKWSG